MASRKLHGQDQRMRPVYGDPDAAFAVAPVQSETIRTATFRSRSQQHTVGEHGNRLSILTRRHWQTHTRSAAGRLSAGIEVKGEEPGFVSLSAHLHSAVAPS